MARLIHRTICHGSSQASQSASIMICSQVHAQPPGRPDNREVAAGPAGVAPAGATLPGPPTAASPDQMGKPLSTACWPLFSFLGTVSAARPCSAVHDQFGGREPLIAL